MKTNWFIFMFISILLLGCSEKSISSLQEFKVIINENESPYIQEKEYRLFSFEAKYLPPSFLASQEMINSQDDNLSYKATLSKYNSSRTFLVRISPNEIGNDLLFNKVENYEEYSELNEELTFNFSEYFSIQNGDKEVNAKTVLLQNTYGIQKFREFLVVFDKIETDQITANSDKLELVYNDLIFETGVSKFSFQKEQIDRQFHLAFIN